MKWRQPVYVKWRSMMNRCYNKNQQNYERYGGAGIRVCPEWHDVEQFRRDMGDPPEGLTLDRIDPTKNYSKDNCRWATVKEQNDTRRHVQRLPDGRIAAHVARANGISMDCFHRRVQRGWDLLRACTEPVVAGRRPATT